MMKTIFLLLGLLAVAQCSTSALGDHLQPGLVHSDEESAASGKAEEESGMPIQFQIKGEMYIYHSQRLSFVSAENACRRAGGHLASIHSVDTNKYVNGVILHYHSNAAPSWIGGKRQAYSSSFIWMDGSMWNYTKWCCLSGWLPNYIPACVQMDHKNTGCWSIMQCNEAKSYVCKV